MYSHINQAKLTRRTNYFFDQTNPHPSSIALEYPSLFIQGIEETRKKVLNYLIELTYRYGSVYCKQETIANQTGISVSTVERCLVDLKAMGLLATNYRHMKSCEYKISSYFYIPSVIKKIARWIPAMVQRICHREGQLNIYLDLFIEQLSNPNEIDILRRGNLGSRFQKGENVEENLKSQKIIDRIYTISGIKIQREQANELLQHESDALEIAMSRLQRSHKAGQEIKYPVRYLIKTLEYLTDSDIKREITQKGRRESGNGLASQRPASPLQRPSSGAYALYKPEPQEDINAPISLEDMLQKIDILEKQKEVMKKSSIGIVLIAALDESIRKTAMRCPEYVRGLKNSEAN